MMSKKFLKTIALSAVICSFGGIDLLKADECTESPEDKKMGIEARKNRCVKIKDCRFAKQGGALIRCYKDTCMQYDGKQEACDNVNSCSWDFKLNTCDVITKGKKGFSNFSN
jgi:hypothetical protein